VGSDVLVLHLRKPRRGYGGAIYIIITGAADYSTLNFPDVCKRNHYCIHINTR
jgi:hypothetical protein